MVNNKRFIFILLFFIFHNQAMRTPSRDATGIGLLYEYYNQLYFFERRFFSPERGLGVFFDWYVIQIFRPAI